MKIAYISFEYPPDTAFGGIAIYVCQIAGVLSRRGQQVHIFCASPYRGLSEDHGNIHIHRIKTEDRLGFKWLVADKFKEINEKESFDILECPEYNADGLIIKQRFGSIPLIVRLHTPDFLIKKLNDSKIPAGKKIEIKLYKFYQQIFGLNPDSDHTADEERRICLLADAIHSPSKSLAGICIKKWKLDDRKVSIIPNVFQPSEELLSIPVNSEPGQRIFYFGRLETRKGLYVFEELIPGILELYPQAEFHFIGKSLATGNGEPFDKYLIRKCSQWTDKLFFRQVNYKEIPREMGRADICIFPSIWENFPNVCLEAMAAGRAILASRNGGMKDMLEDENAGILINPLKAGEIVAQVKRLFTDPSLITEFGEKARKAVLKKYNEQIIGEIIEEAFKSMISLKK